MGPSRPAGRGFTLIELLVAVVIMAILASLAGPSLLDLINDQRAKSAASDLFLAMNVSRSEAVKLNTNVTLSPKGGDWKNGWIIANPAGGANLLDRNATTVPITGGPEQVRYAPSGRLVSADGVPSFTIGASGSTQRCLSVDLSGRPYIKAAAC